MTIINDKKKLYSLETASPRRISRYHPLNRVTPYLILCLFIFSLSLPHKALAAAGTYSSVSIPADVNANTATPVFVMADDLSYNNDSSEIFGQGHAIIKHDEVYIFADRIYANVNTGDISADGNVLVMQKDSRIYTDRMYYNFKTTTAYTENVTILEPPWIVKGKKMKMEGKKTEIESPVFTTCDKEQPHYRMEASMIYYYEDEKIEAWNTIFYIGRIPVLYFPYFYQSLKSNKMPFGIMVGHNDIQGYYADLTYNYVFDQLNNGTIEVDYMEKLGLGYKLTSNYGLSKNCTGSIYGYYTKTSSPLNGTDEHWEGSWNHTQIFNDTTKMDIRLSHVSDSLMSADTLAGSIDNYSQASYMDFSTSFGGVHSLSMNVSDTETLDNSSPDKTQWHYITSARTLPYINYQMMSKEILPRLYLTDALNFTRSYNIATKGLYSDIAGFTPNVTISLPRMGFMSLSGGGGFQSNWQNTDEIDNFRGKFLNTYTANATLLTDIVPHGLLQLTMTQNFARQLNESASLAHEGITGNSLAINLQSKIGQLTIRSNTTYDMLSDPTQVKGDLYRFSLVNTTASMYLDEYSFYASNGYSIYADMIKNMDINFAMGDKEKSLWSMNMGTTYINNLIDTYGNPQYNIKDTLYFTTGMNFAFTEEFSLGVQRRYDLINKTLMDHSYSATWHLHCWDASFSWSKRQDNVEEINFSINISALPQYKLNKPQTIAPAFSPELGTP